MKELIIRMLHALLGYERYVRWFSLFKIRFLGWDRRKLDYIFFNEMLGNDATIAVIGACTGITTAPFALRSSKRRIFAYEPLPSNFRTLNEVLQHHKITNVTTFNIGLGNTKEEVTMILPVIQGTRKHGMAYVKAAHTSDYFSGIEHKIQLDRLDDREELRNVKLDAIKIVAEHFELEIFRGAEKILREQRPVIYCELWHKERRDEVLNFIRGCGYEIYFRKEKELAVYAPEKYAGKNFFFRAI